MAPRPMGLESSNRDGPLASPCSSGVKVPGHPTPSEGQGNTSQWIPFKQPWEGGREGCGWWPLMQMAE